MTTFFSMMGMCVLLTVVLFLCNHKNWRNKKWRPLGWIYCMVILSAGADALWVLVAEKPELNAWNYALNVISAGSLGWIGYWWLRYCLNFDNFLAKKYPWIRYAAAVPVLAITAMSVASCWTGAVFSIDARGVYHRGPLFFIQQSVYLYMILGVGITLYNWRRSRLYSQKKHLFMMTTFIFFPAVVGGAQLLFPPTAVPTMQYSVLISLLLQFADDQERKVTHDSLTKLINRYEFERILDETMARCRKTDPGMLYVLMGDMDQFKHINDSLGHQQGDMVLRAAAKVLRESAQAFEAVVARISGDEFCVILTSREEEDVEKYIRCVQENVRRVGQAWGLPLSISLGYARYDGRMSLPELFAGADRAMYQAKKQYKMQNARQHING